MKFSISERFHSLKFRLMALITLILLIVVGFPLGFFVYQLDKNYNEFSINMIETTSQVVYQFIYDAMMKNDSTAIQKNIKILALDPSIKLVRLLRPSGKILYSSQTEEVNRNISEFSNGFVSSINDKRVIESFQKIDNIYSHHHPVYVQKECTPCHNNQGSLIAILDVQAGFTSSEHIYSTSKNLAIFGGLFIIVILWILLNLLYQSQVESRLKTIISGFQNLAGGNFNFKIKMTGKHELAHLAKKFNQMVDNLKNARSKEDQFFQEKLERADRLVTLGEVAAEIAHEVNNPAGIILTRAEILKEEMQDNISGVNYLEDLEMIIKQTEKIAETTRSILHYSRKLPQTFSVTDLNEIIKHSMKILGPRIKKSKVDIKLNIPSKPTLLWANNHQLEQVFCNLINNSLDFVQQGEGKIRIGINTIDYDKKTARYRIEYQDNGPGIPEEYKKQIFTPFFTTKENGKGTGLGLFIVKNIIANHKGTIKLEQNHKSGARFVIELEAYHGES